MQGKGRNALNQVKFFNYLCYCQSTMIMGRINDKEKYPLQEDINIKSTDYLIGSDGLSKVTKNFSLASIGALLSAGSSYIIDLPLTNFYQNDDLVGIPYSRVGAFLGGQEMETAGLIMNYDSETGTITFPFEISGKLHLFILP